MRHAALLTTIGVLASIHGQAGAQPTTLGIDCTKARSRTEKAICASPALLSLDQQSAAAYADALAREPTRHDALHADLLRWLKARDAACALPAAAIPACLRTQITTRISALAAATPASTSSSTSTGPAAPTAPAIDAALPQPPDPAIPATVLPIAAATLDAASLPANVPGETLLHVTSPGRFAITVKSASGTTLQLIDMLAGPGEVMGIAGSQDGRVDALLDVGTYKLRTSVAEKAAGTASLTVTPFRDAGAPRALPPPGRLVQDTLHDAQQRAFWFAVPAAGPVRVEAAGRSLADLRIWRDGRELMPIEPTTLVLEPVPGHGLTDLRLEGKLEPGTYLAVAYGGPPVTWTDADTAQPFLLRAGLSPGLELGWAGGPMGPFGSEVYAVPPTAALLRLRLPAAAAADLLAGETESLDRRSREPVASLAFEPGHQPTVEVRAAAGQAFTLRALEQHPPYISGSAAVHGQVWLSAIANGTGGDDVPPTVLVQRAGTGPSPARIVASTLPRIGPAAWRTRFNIRGPTALAVQSTGGLLALHSTGTPVDLVQGGISDLPADYYMLAIRPAVGAQGAVEVTAGPPGAVAASAQSWPPDPELPLGIQTLERNQRMVITGVRAPGVQLGLSARPVPVALAEGPLPVTLAANAGITVPIATPPGTVLSVTEIGAGPVPYATKPGTTRDATDVVLPPADHPRTVVLAARRPPVALPPIPTPAALASQTAVQAGVPVFFDLVRDQERRFDLVVPKGGLLRAETLGRLHTSGTLGTAFQPGLAQADANGIGENMLIQRVLRAGRYHVTVRAQDSAGHAGFQAAPAPLVPLSTLHVGDSVRATLPAGTGAAIPILLDAALPDAARTVRLDIASLGAPWGARLEDADGWPLASPGPLDGTTHKLPAGRYRLLVEPAATARQVVVRLVDMPPPAPAITGHGPHALPFGTTQNAVWREPEIQSAPRTPDTWTFTLQGDADVTLTLPRTMTGQLKHNGEPDRRITTRWTGTLHAGSYRLDVTALGRNDRAPYAVMLASAQLQPDVPRQVKLPAKIPFALASARVISLTSFGTTPVKAILRGTDGTVLGRYAARADDWNIGISRPLPPGAYTLELSAAAPPGTSSTTLQDSTFASPRADADTGSSGDTSGDDTASDTASDTGSDTAPDTAPPVDDQAAQTRASQTVPGRNKRAATQTTDSSNTGSNDTGDDTGDDTPAPTVEVRLALPASTPAIPAPAQAALLPGAGVHVLTLDAPAAGALLVAAAQSDVPLVLALEHHTGETWSTIGQDQGRTPAVAVPTGADGNAQGAWRVEIWAVDGGTASIRAAVQAVTPAVQSPEAVTLAALDGMPFPLAAGHAHLSKPGLARVTPQDDLRAGGWPGHELQPLAGAAVLPEGQDIWLLGRPGTVTMSALPMDAGHEIALTVPEGLTATLPALTVPDGSVTLWAARSGSGQPSLGMAMGYAAGSAVALAGPPVSMRAADGGADGASLRLSLRQDQLKLLPAQAVDAALHTVLAPGTALALTLPPGDKSIEAALPPGVAMIPDWHHPHAATWSGSGAAARTVTGAWTTLLLANPGTAPAPVSLSVAPAAAAVPLKPGSVQKRFFGAAGSFEVQAEGTKDARLHVSGPATLAVIGVDGRVTTGTEADSPGTARVIITHGTGAVALWMDAPGVPAWPGATAQPATLPSRVTLSGPAMSFTIPADAPLLLHAATTAPVLLGFAGGAPMLFPSGAELHSIVPAGGDTLRVFPASDGPLGGTLDLRAEPVTMMTEGLGPSTSVPPGGAAAFGFDVVHATMVGVGVQADTPGTTARLLDGKGHVVGTGVAMLVRLTPGRYVLEALVPPGSPGSILRPAVVGIAPRSSGPPPDVVQDYLELAGMKPQGIAR